MTTALRQLFHPEVRAQIASTKANQFETLIRQSEDRIIIIEAKANDKAEEIDQLLELLERVSSEITRINSLSPPSQTAITKKKNAS